ncbi:MAG: hypothetical protein C0506_10355 [Anaerolinea sp.]|nr:hypothetical protein [Anaerolinea sp.]
MTPRAVGESRIRRAQPPHAHPRRRPLSSDADTLPPVAELQANGITINYEDYGDPEAPAVVLLHGYTSDLRMWRGCLDALTRDYRVLAPDLRGHGRSSSPEDGDSYTMETYAEDLRCFLDSLEVEICALVGCSFGGMVALQFAVTWPGRLAGLVLSDTSAAYQNEAYDEAYRERERRIAADQEAMARLGSAGLGRRAAATLADDFLAQGVRNRYASLSTHGYLGAGRARRERADLLGVIGARLTMPVLITTGDRDEVHGASLVMAGRLPGARVVTFKGAAHGIPARLPGPFTAAVLAFLADIEEGKPIAGTRTV